MPPRETAKVGSQHPDLTARARMPFFALVGYVLPESMADRIFRPPSSTEKVVWSRVPGSIAAENYLTGLLAALTGWELVRLMLVGGFGLGNWTAGVLALPLSFILWHVAVIISSLVVTTFLPAAKSPLQMTHYVMVTGLTLGVIPVIKSDLVVWPWVVWMLLNFVAWFLLALGDLFRSLGELE